MTARVAIRGTLLILLVGAIAALTGCREAPPEEVVSEAVVAVQTALATRGDIRGVIHATGVVAPGAGGELVVIAPEVARVAEVPWAVGDRVRKGAVLVRFEIPSVAADVQRQAAEVARAEAALANATSAQTRARALFDRGVAARREVEDSTRAVAEAEAALAQARASRLAALELSERVVVRASFDGVIAKRLHNAGDLVEPTAADPVLRVVDLTRLEVIASVPLADVSRLVAGASARLTGGPDSEADVQLRVLARPAAVDAGTATVPVRLGLRRPADVPVGLPVQVLIDAEQHRDVVLVPIAALVRDADETAIFLVSGEKAERRSVEIGLMDAASVEIVSGVAAGDQLIVDGQAGLPDGSAITVREAAQPERSTPSGSLGSNAKERAR